MRSTSTASRACMGAILESVVVRVNTGLNRRREPVGSRLPESTAEDGSRVAAALQGDVDDRAAGRHDAGQAGAGRVRWREPGRFGSVLRRPPRPGRGAGGRDCGAPAGDAPGSPTGKQMTDSPMREIERRLAAGEVVLLDGATGTELERRGAPMHDEVWCGAATLSHGGLLREIHEDYIRAGASVVIANTYGSNRIMLEPAGLGGEVEAVNRRAVEIAREARDRAAGGDAVAVAGSMSHMVPQRHDPAWAPSPARAAECFAEMAETLAAAGADLIIMEMMSNPDLARPAVAAALTTGLPVWIGYSAIRGEHREPVPFLRPDLTLADMLNAVHSSASPVQGFMHTSVDLTGPALTSLREVFDGPALAYPDSGYFEMPNWQFVDIVSPAEVAAAARGWIEENGVQVVGGCCGLGVEHVEALAETLVSL